jgi:hypothetical protein
MRQSQRERNLILFMDKVYIGDSHFFRRWFGYNIDFEVTVTSYR